MKRKVDRPEQNDSDMPVDSFARTLGGTHDSVYVTCIYRLGDPQAARLRPGEAQRALRAADSLPLGKQLWRLGQSAGGREEAARRGFAEQGHAALRLQRLEARASAAHGFGRAARAALRQPRRGRQSGRHGAKRAFRRVRRYYTWETEFRRIGLGLGGGSGWVVLGYNVHTAQAENYWLWDHLHGPPATMPLLVMDMYEHSYQMDFGAATAKYVDAFFQNIRWDVVITRLGQARRLAKG